MSRHLLIFLDKSLFRVIFYVVFLLSKVRKKQETTYDVKVSGSENLLVIRPGGLGDGLMSIPLLRALRDNYPNIHITVICVQKNKAALQNLSFLNEVLVIDDLRKLHRTVLKLLKNRFHVVFDLEPFRKISSVIAYLSGANVRIGFDTNDRRLLYTHLISYANDKCYESINIIRQLKVLSIHVPYEEAIDMNFTLPDDSIQKAKATLLSHNLSAETDFIVAVVPGVLKNHHRWIMSRFASLIDLIQWDDVEAKVILLGASADIPDAQEVVKHVSQKESVINLVGKTDFMEALAILQACKILIACDGGVVYMAAAMGCSTISIWGPGVMDRFKPPGDNHIGIRKDYFCVPCVNYSRLGEFPRCPYDRRCIMDISAEEVFAAYVGLTLQLSSRKNEVALQKVSADTQPSYPTS
jgi:ADP-heptose:LPS heptosyltransferase